MVWGCFTEHGIGLIHREPQGVKVNAEEYIKILTEGLLPSLKLFSNANFMQYNALCNKAKAVSYWFTEINIKVFEDWPPQSPELNPIKNLWEYVNRNLTNYITYNIEQLWLAVKDVWQNISQETTRKLIHSMSNRLHKVIKCCGVNTKY